MKSSYAHHIRQAVRHLGVDISRYPRDQLAYRRVLLLLHHGIKVVLDVGANDGGYAKELRALGYSEEIVSFEPLRSAFAKLRSAAGKDDRWTAVNVGLGEASEQRSINVAGNSTSSSFLPMCDHHLAAAPQARYMGRESVKVIRLDDVFDDYCGSESAFLKLDVQGFEEQVLLGGQASLRRISGVQIELSLLPLYDGAWEAAEALGFFRERGFELVSVEPGFYDRQTGRLLQFDGIFMRPISRPGGAG